MRSRKLAWFLMLGLLIALAGCGSDGNGGGTTVMPDPPPVDMDALNAAKAAAMTAYNEAKQAVADVEAHKSADMDSYDMAVAKRDEAMAANGKAQAAETVADAEKYRDEARTANMDAMTYAGMVTTAAGTAADRAMAAAIAPAIADPDGDGEFPESGDLRGTRTASKDPTNSPTVSSRPGGTATFMVAAGGAVTVDSNGDTADTEEEYADTLGMDDVSRENQFEMQTGAPPALSDDSFTGSVHERTMDKVTDTLTVYTNVEGLKAEAYNDYFAAEIVSDTNPNGRPAVVTAPLADDSADGRLTLGGDASAVANHANLFGGSFFVKPPNNDQNELTSVAGDDKDNPANEVDGTFAGVPGKFVCSSGTCDVTFDADGMLTAISAGWEFVPTSTDVEVQNVIRDTDFLTFGYWLQATEDDEGETTYGVRTFATGGTASDAADVITLEGEATYSGAATGMYAKKTFDGRGVGTPTSSGQFTADAMLTARFGGPDIAVSKQFQINGEVSNFMDGDGNAIDDMWTVELMMSRLNTVTDGGNEASDYTNDVFSGATTGDGEWEGRFFGTVAQDADTDTAGNQSTLPTGVAGEFNGHFSNGHVIGAFGATKDE